MTPAQELGYKVGDQFIIIDGKDTSFSLGSIVELCEDDGTRVLLFKLISGFCDYNKSGCCYEYLCNIKPYKKQESKQMNKSWTFNVIAPEYQIDFNEIRKDLSSSNPVALVEFDKTDMDSDARKWIGYILIHHSILEKAVAINAIDADNIYMRNFIEVENKQEFKHWIEWVKEVKKTNWPKDSRNKGKVTVKLVSV